MPVYDVYCLTRSAPFTINVSFVINIKPYFSGSSLSSRLGNVIVTVECGEVSLEVKMIVCHTNDGLKCNETTKKISSSMTSAKVNSYSFASPHFSSINEASIS